MMTDILRNFIHLVWTIIGLIPMPWRNIIFVLIFIIFLSWLIWRVLPWLLDKILPLFLRLSEFIFAIPLFIDYHLLTQKRRKNNLQPLLISYILGDLVSFFVKIINAIVNQLKQLFNYLLNNKWFPHKAFLIFPSIILLLTYYIIPSSKSWWYSFDNWVATGQWETIDLPDKPIPSEKFVRYYFNLINNNQYRKAYNCLSSNFQKNRTNYDDYLDWWDIKVQEVNITEIKTVSEDNSSAIVDVRLQYLMRKTQKFESEPIRLYLIWDSQKNQWLIDSSKYI